MLMENRCVCLVQMEDNLSHTGTNSCIGIQIQSYKNNYNFI